MLILLQEMEMWLAEVNKCRHGLFSTMSEYFFSEFLTAEEFSPRTQALAMLTPHLSTRQSAYPKKPTPQ
jgi:hypothetical protein